jgi:DNA-binding winged helix-turn-helix (wHTH) protein/tetratricopeptide (TPR) repeat protein
LQSLPETLLPDGIAARSATDFALDRQVGFAEFVDGDVAAPGRVFESRLRAEIPRRPAGPVSTAFPDLSSRSMKYVFGQFELNPAMRELLRGGSPVALRPRSLECLIYLIEHRDRAVGRDELISAVWGRVDVGDPVVAQTLLRARKALDDTGSRQGMIRTLPRFGYRWVAPIREVASSSDPEENRPRDDAEYGYGAEVASPAAGDAGDYAVIASVYDVDTPDGDSERAYGAETVASVAGPYIEADVGDGAATVDAVAGSEGTAAGTMHASKKNRRQLRVGLLAGVTLLVAAGLGFLLHGHFAKERPQAMANDAVLVMPVAVVPMDSENAWVRLGAMDYMAARLRSSGINVLPSEQALRLGAAIDGDAPGVARKKLLALSGARWIALPEMRRQGKAWSVRMRVLDAGSERTIVAHGDTVLAAAADAADGWLRQSGEQGRTGPPPGPLAERLHRIDAEILAGRLTEARRLVRSSSPAERGDARLLLREGKLEFRAANLDAAFQRFQSALDRTPATDMGTRIGAMMGLGSVERAQNDLEAAELRYTQALALLETLPVDRVNSRMLGIAYQGRGISRAQLGDLEAGVKDMGQARVWLQRSGDQITLGSIGHNLGKAEALRGDYVQALREFDRSIDTFERFRVYDYLANSLREKADVQLALARPAEASGTIGRADALLPKLEDDGLAAEILMTKARIQIALGRLREADATLAGSRSRGVPDTDPIMLELRLRLQLARGAFSQARLLAANGVATKGAGGGLLLAAVQAALRGRDVPLAKAWLAVAAAQGKQAEGDSFALALAGALIDRADGAPAAALKQAEKAAMLAGNRASPDSEIQTGVLRAMVLLDTHQYAAASAIMGELEKYSETDYRVALVMSRLYQALGDRQAVASARGRAMALSGERAFAVEPVL